MEKDNASPLCVIEALLLTGSTERLTRKACNIQVHHTDFGIVSCSNVAIEHLWCEIRID